MSNYHQKTKNRILIFDSYIENIKKSVGTKMFQDLFMVVNGKKKNILGGGDLSCATYVSSVLLMYGLLKGRHATVNGTIKDMEKSGWRKIKKPKIGSVIVWEPYDRTKFGSHWHLGFYIGQEKAISNSSVKKVPIVHHFTFGVVNGKPARKISSIWWNDKLNS